MNMTSYSVFGGSMIFRLVAGLGLSVLAVGTALATLWSQGALDPLTRAEMQTMLRELLQRTEVTTLIVTHDLDEALYLADRVVLLEGGAIVADLARAEVRESPNEAMQKYVAATHREVMA